MTLEAAEPQPSAQPVESDIASSNDPHHRSKRFRFKAHHSSPNRYHSSRNDDRSRSPSSHNSSTTHRSHGHHYHHSKRHQKSRPSLDDPIAYDDSVSNLPPDTAFRESLFDALGDDEGAAYWEGVYGQPIHTYPDGHRDAKTGKLEKMNEEEYVAYVRRKMWEKSWEGVEAERQERRRIREEERSRPGGRDSAGRDYNAKIERGSFDTDVEDSLRRGEERRRRKRWIALWENYLRGWEDLQNFVTAAPKDELRDIFLRNKIVWPVESRKRVDVTTEEVQRFFLAANTNKAAAGIGANEDGAEATEAQLLNTLKTERVRWHPDKIQQRYGSLEIDEGTMKGVTAVFQVIDRMWNERKKA